MAGFIKAVLLGLLLGLLGMLGVYGYVYMQGMHESAPPEEDFFASDTALWENVNLTAEQKAKKKEIDAKNPLGLEQRELFEALALTDAQQEVYLGNLQRFNQSGTSSGSSGRRGYSRFWSELDLTEKQQEQRRKIQEKYEGGFDDPDYVAAINDMLTAEQREKLAAARERMARYRASREAMEKAGIAEAKREKIRELMREHEGKLDQPAFQDAVTKLITDEQWADLKDALANPAAWIESERTDAGQSEEEPKIEPAADLPAAEVAGQPAVDEKADEPKADEDASPTASEPEAAQPKSDQTPAPEEDA